MARALDLSEKESFQLVTFQYGDPASPLFARYTDWAQDAQAGFAFTSVPAMEVDLPELNGTFERAELEITMPLDTFTDRASKILPHSPIFVKVEDVTRGTIIGSSASELTFFRGRVVDTVRNKDGKPGIMSFKCLSRKSRMNVPLGLQCNSHCIFTLFGRGCQLVQMTFDESVLISAATGKMATINTPAFTAPSSPGGNVARFWERGYLQLLGLRLSIRDWQIATPSTVFLRRTVPPEWVGQTVLAVPGCHKTIEDCRTVWNNEPNFGGYGYGMQDYNPLFEDPK